MTAPSRMRLKRRWHRTIAGSPMTHACLIVEIDDEAYDDLNRLTLDLKKARRLTQRIRKRRATRTHLEGVGCVSTIDRFKANPTAEVRIAELPNAASTACNEKEGNLMLEQLPICIIWSRLNGAVTLIWSAPPKLLRTNFRRFLLCPLSDDGSLLPASF